MKRLRCRLTYANVISTLALFLVLAGGSAFAASQLGKNTVGAKQLKKGAVTPSKLSRAAKRTLAGATGPIGPRGAPGNEGAAGKNLTAETPLASGQTETGVFSASGTGEGSFPVAVVNFVQPLPAALDNSHVLSLPPGKTAAACPGVGRAAPGYFCAYLALLKNAYPEAVPSDPATGAYGANKDGTQILFYSEAPGPSQAYGTWAVTAP